MRNLCLSAIVLLTALALAGQSRAADLIPWAPNLDAAREQAGRESKLLFVHFWSTDCEPCKKVEQYVFSDQRVADSMTRYFVPVKIDAKAMPDVAKQYNVRSWPTDVVMTPTGQVMAKMVSPQGVDTYLTMINQVAANGGLGTVQNLYSTASNFMKPGANPPPSMPNQYQPAANQTMAPPAQASGFAGNAPSLMGAPAPQGGPSGGAWGQAPQAVGAPGNYGAGSPYAGLPPTANPALPSSAQQAAGNVRQWAAQHQDPNAIVGNVVNQAAAPGGSWGAPNGGVVPASTPPNMTAPGAQPPVMPPHAQPQMSPPPGAPLGAPGSMAPPPGGPANPAVVSNPMVAPKAPAIQLPAGSPPLAMEGYCPVTLRNNQKWIRGDVKFGAVHRGRTYLFTSPDAQKAFLANPDSFSPVLSGIDPVRFSEQGERIDGRRQHGVYYRNQVYLFSSEDSLQRFWTAPERYSRIVEQAMAPSATGGTQMR